ncbi:hypothetical protein [Pseudomonas oryzihabitans]|uniref:hypothetical protein n=1 Tax=Pseudomonas oryzihabitans TaxID=47885 RepID=UPI003628C7B4
MSRRVNEPDLSRHEVDGCEVYVQQHIQSAYSGWKLALELSPAQQAIDLLVEALVAPNTADLPGRIDSFLDSQPAAAHGDEAVRKDAERLDFILTKARKVVVDCISSGRFDVYVEEGIMGDVAYPGVRREFTPGVGSTQELAVMREAIDAAMRAQGDGEVQ